MRSLLILVATALLGAPTIAQQTDSAPRSERVKIPSKALGSDVSAVVHLPAGYDSGKGMTYPVLFFLHGAGRGSERTWGDRGTNKAVQKLVKDGKLPPVIVICPGSRGTSLWINWYGQDARRHGDFVTKEMPVWAEKAYRIRKGRAFRGLMGDSMGGYGALANALRHPDVFGAVSAHEPAIYPEDRSKLPSWISGGRRGRGGLLTRVFGDPVNEKHWLAHNPFAMVKKMAPGALKDLPIYFDVGTQDRYGLAEPCQAWARLLTEKKVAHTFNLRDAGHGRRFFEESVPDSLTFHGRVFTAAAAAARAAAR